MAKRTTTKAPVPASEVQKEVSVEVSTSEAEVATLTLDEYLKIVPVHIGLVASFKYECRASGLGLEPKSAEAWKMAFTAQSNKTYE
jgi:hypothetical protein